MATFTEIYYNGNEYKEMWLNGSKIWEMEKDYSQYINLQEASGQTDIYFEDYYDTPSPYWAGVFNSETYLQKAMYITLNPHIKTKYVLIKGILKTNMDYSQLYLQGSNSSVPFSANGGEVTSGNFDTDNHYEFEAVLRISNDTRIKFSNTRGGIGWGAYIGNMTIEPYDISIITEYVHLTKVANYPVITSITLESTLTDTTITKGTQFTITPTITPTNHNDELIITYDTNSLSMVDNTFTVLDTATIGQQLDITYSSKNNPSVSATYSVTIRDSISITSIVLTHTLESLTDVAIGTTFTVVPTVEPLSHDDELLVDYDTNYLSKDGDNYTVLGGASEQTVQVIYYSKHDNNVNAMIEFTVAEKAEKEPIVTTYTTFNKESTSEYCSFKTDAEANTMTIKYTYTGSSYYHSSIYTKLDTILPRKCRVRITGESQGTYKYMSHDGEQYPTNSIICLSARGNYNNAWWSSHSMPSDGIVYNNGATQTTSEALDYDVISLYQLNPSQYYLSSSSTNFYPFEYDFTYCFPSEPRLYLNYATHVGGYSGKMNSGTYVTYKDLKIEVYEYPIESIYLTTNEDVNNITNAKFTINSTILPSLYSDNDLEIIYDETYMKIDVDTGEVKLKNGCQGLTHTVTYRSKSDNSISKSITFTVSQDLEIGMDAIDFTQSTAPTLPDCMTLDGQGSSYYFKHGTYTTNVYGLVPNNSGVNSSVAYTRYKFVAPKDGALTFTYRCSSESNYDYLTVHVDSSTSQPSVTSTTNQVFTTKGVSSYKNTDGTASVNVTSGTTYYIHIQYYKDSRDNSGYDKGCIRKIELL